MSDPDFLSLTTEQSLLGKKIDEFISRFKHIRPLSSRVNAGAYFQQQLAEINKLWEEFELNHDAISAAQDKDVSDIYFSSKFYDKVKSAVESFTAKINEQISLTSAKQNLSLSLQNGPNMGASTPSGVNTAGTEGAAGSEQNDVKKTINKVLATEERDFTFTDHVFHEPDRKLSMLLNAQHIDFKALNKHLDLIEAKLNQSYTKSFYLIKSSLINGYWERITENHTKLLCGNGYSTDDIQDYLELETKYQEILTELSSTIDNIDSNEQAAHMAQRPSVQMQRVTITPFSGDYLDWKRFKGVYTQCVHNQPYSDIEKMHYLTNAVTGEAKGLIKHLAETADNYESAWTILNDRYENYRVLVFRLVKKMCLQASTQANSVNSIKIMHDTTKECLMALQNMKAPVEYWDDVVMCFLLDKLDPKTRDLFELSYNSPKTVPSIKLLITFLENRFQTMEAVSGDSKGQGPTGHSHAVKKHSFLSTEPSQTKCILCSNEHPLYVCGKFLALSPKDRYAVLYQNKLCINCLKPGHLSSSCSSGGCRKCSRKHNTLVHTTNDKFQPKGNNNRTVATANIVQNKSKEKNFPKQAHTGEQPQSRPSTSAANNQLSFAAVSKDEASEASETLLGTAVIDIYNQDGEKFNCRAVLDSGSQTHFITKRMQEKLRLRTSPASINVLGVGEVQLNEKLERQVNVHIGSKHTDFKVTINACVLNKICTSLPSNKFSVDALNIPRDLQIADPRFNIPQKVDLLIGAQLFYKLLANEKIELGDNLPVLMNTVLGWIVGGNVPMPRPSSAICGITSEADINLEKQVERFWKLQEVGQTKERFTAEEAMLEKFFDETTTRDKDGRFVVKLPFIKDPSTLGNSRNIALRCFLSVERKLQKNPELKKLYRDFMKEYQELGHMKMVNSRYLPEPHYFFPHHCVLRPESASTPARVVFNGSQPTTSTVSLNDIMGKGPQLQAELFTTLVRFTLHKYAFTADVQKMFRQILVAEEDRKFQLIFWRENPEDPIDVFELTTVTYGTNSAPYISVNCLIHVAKQNEKRYPLGSQAILKGFYVDDYMGGADSFEEAQATILEVSAILESAKFKLRKWCSNNLQLIKHVPEADRAIQLEVVDEKESTVGTLGLIWQPKTDQFQIKVTSKFSSKITKRSVLSETAQLFDPLGFISPVIVKAKIFLQALWKEKLDWDDPLPEEMQQEWSRFQKGLPALTNIHIPRHMYNHNVPTEVQLHAFADASEKAYGSAIYLRAISADNIVTVKLLCSKSRVAPKKQTTLPKLELAAAKLTAEFSKRIRQDMNLPESKCHYWSDSEIVLAWINSESSLYQTFVANRISDIQEHTNAKQWRHVRTKENPADVVSRGTTPEKLLTMKIWFNGPDFLYEPEDTWGKPYVSKKTDVEGKKNKVVLIGNLAETRLIDFINHRNKFIFLQRTVAYMLRMKQLRPLNNNETRIKRNKALSVNEYDDALNFIMQQIHQECFAQEIKDMRRNGSVSASSRTNSLSPFLDHNNVIRVGGRLEASLQSYDSKHQILLPNNHWVTSLIMEELHRRYQHAAPQALLTITRQKYWPINGKVIANSIVNNCVQCRKAKPKLLFQMMGNLPSKRIQEARPFLHSGVDFFGPVEIHYKLRGKRACKTYVAVFVCFATKAVHLEVVSDLTTDAFIGALRRFTNRRGNCRHLFCDNATNFVGAKNRLSALKEEIHSDRSKESITTFCTSKGIDFHFIPPRSPHFGGLWEAAVKSAKKLMTPSITSASLTYEELETLMTDIEAILNSRPLTPLSTNPNDMAALTPGHFLIGEPLTNIVDADVKPLKEGMLSRWKLVTQLKNQFWQRWSSEYLNQLQQRSKWKQDHANIKTGTMVLVKEDNLPPSQWKLGRVVSAIKGADEKIRVADVKTATGIFRRAIHKLAPLPVEDDTVNEPDTPQENENIIQEDEITHSTQCVNPTINTKKKTSLSATSEHPKKPKGRVNFNPTAFLKLFLVFCTAQQAAAQMKASPFTSPPGIYFENLGNTHLVSNEWNLIVYYNTSFLWRELKTIKYNINQLTAMCNTHPEKEDCKTLVQQFLVTIEDIEDTNKLIFQHQNTTRIKRGAIDFVGNIAHALFGVLDSEYADEMANQIETLKNDDKRTLALIKKQTSIIDSTVNLVQRSEINNKKRYIEMQTYINSTLAYIKDANWANRQQRVKTTINTLSIQLLIIMQNYQRIHSTILDVVTNSHQGKIHPMLLSPSQLEHQIEIIRKNIPTFLRLPADTEDVLKFYQLMTVEGRVSAKYQQIIFCIRVPLYSHDQFELLRVVPVPFEDNSTITIIQSVAEYLIINLHRDQYYPITKEDLKECVIYQDEYICKQHRPLYNRESKVSTCEVSIINHWPWSRTCQTKLVTETTQWIQLLQPNHWIYCLFKRTTLTVVHNDTSTSYALEGTGIIELQPGCSIKDSGMTITGHNIYTSQMKKSIIPSKTINEFIDDKPPEEIKFQHFIENNMVNHIKNLQDDIKTLREHEDETTVASTHHSHHYVVQYFTLALVLVLIFVWWWQRRKQAQPEQPAAQQAPPERPDFIFKNIEQPSAAQCGGVC